MMKISDWIQSINCFKYEKKNCPLHLYLIYDSQFDKVLYRVCATLIRHVDFSPGKVIDHQAAFTCLCKYYRRPIKFLSSDLHSNS